MRLRCSHASPLLPRFALASALAVVALGGALYPVFRAQIECDSLAQASHDAGAIVHRHLRHDLTSSDLRHGLSPEPVAYLDMLLRPSSPRETSPG